MKILFRKVRFRSIPSYPELPFSVRSVGETKVLKGYIQNPGPRNIIELIWIENGNARIKIDGIIHEFTDGHAVVLRPLSDYSLVPVSDKLHFFWLTIDGNNAENFVGLFNFSLPPFRAGKVPKNDFNQLQLEIIEPTPRGQCCACATALKIIIKASSPHAGESQGQSIIKTAIEIINMNISNPDLNLNWVMQKIQRDRSTFSRLFKAEVGMSPSKYIFSLRMQRAVNLLQTTNLSILEISYNCGFSDPNYY